jgi:hypothetical protein
MVGDIHTPQRMKIQVPNTNLSRTLGNGVIDVNDGMNVDEDEYGVLQSILELYAQKRQTHAQVVLQSLAYRDVAFEAISGKFDANRMNPHCSVNSVVAAMFIPKIPIFDEHMLMANMAYIVKQRYSKKPIETKPDYELFYDLISDPNDVVCNADSPIRDLYNRCKLQCSLWDSVLALRNGRYYDCSNTNFLMNVDQCKINNYDAPDLVYISDEGAVIRRLLGAFSFRPTIVKTTPTVNVHNMNQSTFRNTVAFPKVTSQAIITLRVPHNNANQRVDLRKALNDVQLYMDEDYPGVVIPKKTKTSSTQEELLYSTSQDVSTL